MTPATRLRWLLTLSLLVGLSGWALVRGSAAFWVCLGLALLGSGLLVYQLWRPWMGARTWVRLRYHAATPPNPMALHACLTGLLDQEVVVVRWRREAGGLSLWLQVPAALVPRLAATLIPALPELHLEPAPAPLFTADQEVAVPRYADTGGDPRLIPLWDHLPRIDAPAEVRLLLWGPRASTLLWLGVSAAPASFHPPRWCARGPHWGAGRAWLVAHYPWATPWPPPGALPPLPFPATTGPDTAPLDSRAAYHLPPPCLPAPDGPALDLGTSTVTGEPIRIALACPPSAPADPGDPSLPRSALRVPRSQPLWQGHFLSLGSGEERYRPLAHLVAQARALGVPVLALDPQRRLLPAVQRLLLDPAVHPAWITRRHPRHSLRFNLLSVPPTPAPGYTPEGGALHLALTSALPLFQTWLAGLGVLPWSTTSGGIWLADLALVRLLAHHRARLARRPPPPVPTLATLYADLGQDTDLGALLEAELTAWLAGTLAGACGPTAGMRATYTQVHRLLAAACQRWAGVPLAAQQAARARLRTLLAPLWDAPGFRLLGQGRAAPGGYWDAAPAALVLTDLLPPDPTERDAVLAGWYAEYLLLTLVAVAHGRRFAARPAPPLLVLLDDLPPWTAGVLRPEYLALLGAAGIACAAASARLPTAPAVLAHLGTWWLHALPPAAWARLQPAVTGSGAADLPLPHFPPDRALLWTRQPTPHLATVTFPSRADPVATAGGGARAPPPTEAMCARAPAPGILGHRTNTRLGRALRPGRPGGTL